MSSEGLPNSFGLSERSSVESFVFEVSLKALEQAYLRHSASVLNRLKPPELSSAVNWWVEDAHPGQYLGAFWTGEEPVDDGVNLTYRVVCIASKKQ